MFSARRHRSQYGNSTVNLVFGVALVALAFLLWANRQWITDWVAYRQYQPSAMVAQITSRDTMTSDGQFYFYASHPMIEAAKAFNTDCTRKESSTAILGCYSNDRIYVYDVTNQELEGIQEVTAAHETLHAVYQRMSTGDRQAIDVLLEKEYAKRQNDKSLTDRMKYYAKSEAGERDNELHSILGTEYSGLDPALEAHYARYFSNRQAIVDMHAKYASVFDDLAAKASALSNELQSLGTTIQKESSDYNNTTKELNVDIQTFNSKASQAGSFSSQSDFNNQRAALTGRVSALDSERTNINSDIARYNALRDAYNQTAESSNNLYKSIDSLAPVPSVK